MLPCARTVATAPTRTHSIPARATASRFAALVISPSSEHHFRGVVLGFLDVFGQVPAFANELLHPFLDFLLVRLRIFVERFQFVSRIRLLPSRDVAVEVDARTGLGL